MRQSATDLGLERADEAPAQISEHILPSGRRIRWAMPDLFAVLAFTGTVPDPVTAAVIKLLTSEGSYVPEDDPRSWHHKAEHLRGMYGIVAAGLIEPTLDLAREWGDGQGVLGRRDLSWADVEYAYHILFRLGTAPPPIAPAAPDDAGGSAEPAPAGDDVPPAAE